MASKATGRAFDAYEDPPQPPPAAHSVTEEPASPATKRVPLQTTPQTYRMPANASPSWGWKGGPALSTQTNKDNIDGGKIADGADSAAGSNKFKKAAVIRAGRKDQAAPVKDDDTWADGDEVDDKTDSFTNNHDDSGLHSDSKHRDMFLADLSEEEQEDEQEDEQSEADENTWVHADFNFTAADGKTEKNLLDMSMKTITDKVKDANKELEQLEKPEEGAVLKKLNETFRAENDKPMLRQAVLAMARVFKQYAGNYVSPKDEERVIDMVKFAIKHYSNRYTNYIAAKSWVEKCSVAWTHINDKDEKEKQAAAARAAEERKRKMKLSMPSGQKMKAIKL